MTGPEPSVEQTSSLPGAPADALASEQQLGGSSASRAVNSWLLALSRAARSFSLYDPKNAMVRSLIGEYRAKAEVILKQGPVKLEVRAFELAFEGEEVYVEKDRERSLAFRLFRDGVRGLTLKPDVSWEEQLKLLEIFSVRYSGVRQQEDDLVTLLRKASFKGVEIEAVEGFKPDEETPEQGAAQAESAEPGAVAPASLSRRALPEDFDHPLPALGQMGRAAFVAPNAEALARLAAEEGPARMPVWAVRAVGEAFQLARPPSPLLEVAEALDFAEEVRAYLLVEERADALFELGAMLASFLSADPAQLAQQMKQFVDQRFLEVAAHSLPEGGPLPPKLVALLDRDPLHSFELAAALVEQELGKKYQRQALALLVLLGRAHLNKILEKIRTVPPAQAAGYLEALRELDPARASQAALELAPRAEPAMQLNILLMLSAGPLSQEAANLAKQLLCSPDPGTRREVVQVLAKRGGPRGFPLLHDYLAAQAPAGIELEMAEEIAVALAELSARTALASFEAWAKPGTKGLLGRINEVPGARVLRWAAVAGLAKLPGSEAEALLKQIQEREKGDAELHRHVLKALSTRRRGAAPPNPASTPAPAASPAHAAAPAPTPTLAPSLASVPAPTPAPAAKAVAVQTPAAPAATSVAESPAPVSLLPTAVEENADASESALRQAQSQLGRAIERARVGEDRELAALVREQGEHLVSLLSGLLRMGKIHAADNRAFDQPVAELSNQMARLAEALGAIHLLTVEDQVYINEIRIRLADRGGRGNELASEFSRHNIGGIVFFAPLAAPQVRLLLSAFASKAPETGQRNALAEQLRAKGLDSLELQGTYRFRKAGEAKASPVAAAPISAPGNLAVRALAAVDEAYQNLAMGRQPNPLTLRRIITEMLEGDLGSPQLFGLRKPERALAAHAVRTAQLSLLLARQAQLSQETMQDLGLTALYHDVGYALSEPSAAVDLARHPGAGAKMMLRQRGFNLAKLRRFLGIAQHHREASVAGTSLPGRILRIAEDYDNLVHRGANLSPAQVLAGMLAGSGTRYDPALLQLFVNALGRFPPGTLIELDDGRVVVALGLPRSPETFERPLARVLRMPGGIAAPANLPLIDLAAERPMKRILARL